MATPSLKEFLVEKNLASTTRRARIDLSDLEAALQQWTIQTGSSRTKVKEEVRAMGVNLATGAMCGSPSRLAVALRNGAPTVPKKRAKAYPLVKSCLVAF